jgi:ferritin-like metal-binding protein YciE
MAEQPRHRRRKGQRRPSYRVLIAAAQDAGDVETVRVFEEICREEEDMASWLFEHIPETTRTYLAREHADMDEAKR